MTNSFDFSIDFLRQRRNSKWRRYPEDVIPSWIADMDFAVAPAIRETIEKVIGEQDFGYPRRTTAPAELDVAAAFSRRMAALYGWQIDPALTQPVTDLIQATSAAVVAFTDPGDSVIVQTPCYPPFRQAIAEAGRVMLDNPLVDRGNGYEIDFDGLEAAIDGRTRLWILCNPQNPTGRVFTREELERIGAVAARHDILIFSDEIHSDLVYDGHRHIPIGSLPEAAERTITANSPTKSFNMPGLRCGVMHFGSAELRQRFHRRVPKYLIGKPAIVGIDATVAAWDASEAFLGEIMAHLRRARDFVVSTIHAELPHFGLHAPEATYLAWIRTQGVPVPAADYYLEKARIGFSPGETFSPDCGAFVRMNFATSMPILEEKLARFVSASRATA